ncbi:DnaJ domain-containing protein [Rhodobacteraceae bacterium LMO-12]|nr:DnaJ domain-containing protein [Rhodobacteraceae bacterium LMO-JJ12]
MSDDPYAALGLTKSATDAEIKKAYRKIARTSHPDLNPDDPDAETRFKAASHAYDLLKDPETRARFDRGEIDASGAERHQQQHPHQQQRQYYREYAEDPGNPYRSARGGPEFDDASDIFAEFLRQQGGGRRQGSANQSFDIRGQNRRYALEVAFLDAVNGGDTHITLPDGSSLKVKIPKGSTDGQTIRLRGKGDPGFGKGPPGDALITLSVRPHPLFRRDGNDILITLPITFDEAVLGGKVEAPTIDGTVNLTVPKGANSGQTLRLRGRGASAIGSDKRGDQLVELRIVAPPKIDDALADFMQDWRKTNHYDPRKGMKI